MKKQLRFFGNYAHGMPSVPIPFGLRCYYCEAPFSVDAQGVVFVKHNASRAAHRDCFVRGAVRLMLDEFFE